jgi:hypothetical protein
MDSFWTEPTPNQLIFVSLSHNLCVCVCVCWYSREDLIAKTITDIPTFDREMAEKEVDQFLMDCEMVNLYIQYGKEVEKDPDFVVPNTDPDDNGLFSVRNIVIGYLTYLTTTSIAPQMIRRYVAEQEVAGEWKPTNIGFFDDWIERTSPEATARVLQKAAEKVTEAVSAAVVSVSSNVSPDATDISSTVVVDTLQTVVGYSINS